MSTTSQIVDRIANRIGTVATAGVVHKHALWTATTIQPLWTSTIAGTPTLRAWHIDGPQSEGQYATRITPPYVERYWTFTLTNIEGADSTGNGAHLLAQRDVIELAMNAIDADLTLNGTVFRSWPCQIQIGPENRQLLGIGLGYCEITKRVMTCTPAS